MATTVDATQSVRLANGRTLAYAEYGDPSGRPVLYCHGWGASRLTRHPDDALTASLGVRLVTVDRPGVGGSSFQPRRRLLDWPVDMAQLADQLGLRRFAVFGHSGGGPFALACGAAIPERLTAIAVACGFAPMDRPGATEGMRKDMARAMPLMRRLPWLARPMLTSLPRQYRKDPERAFEKQFGQGLPAADRAALAQPDIHTNILQSAVEALRPGSKGMAQEMPLFMGRPWGFRPEQVQSEVSLWYGDADPLTPPQMGEYLAGAIPQSHLTVYPGEGHMVYINHWAEILRTLAAAS
jgi:pimeloyl-ACP methyl ester carboxylesterase